MIKVRALGKRRGQQTVLSQIDLEVARGEIHVIVGPSGSGKTTLLRCLNGLESFDEGSAEIAGEVLRGGALPDAELLRSVRRKVGMVFQGFHLFAHLSLLDNVTLAPRTVLDEPAASAAERARSLLARVGLSNKERRFPRELSGGEQQRGAIARALAMRPDVLLFDEPTSALDARSSREVLELMRELGAGGQTMVVVTHALSFARQAATTLHVLADGVRVESGPPAQVLDNPTKEATRRLVEAD
ncbi:MAG: amino acid ABC transporter ATP-binding protein [Polyangiaceae bacterium]